MLPRVSMGEGRAVQECASTEGVHFLRVLASSRGNQERRVHPSRVSSQEWEEDEKCVSKVGDRWNFLPASTPGDLQSQLLSPKEGATRLAPASRREGWGC